jgi:hypothetical protein
VTRGLPASAAVRSRVTAAAPLLSAERVWYRRQVLASRRRLRCRRWPDHRSPEGRGRPPPCPVAPCGGSSGHRRHEPCVPRFGCLATPAAFSRLAPRQARACLCANLWMTCAKARRICAQRAVNGGDSQLAAPFEGAVTCENTIRALCSGRKLKMSTGHTEMVHI